MKFCGVNLDTQCDYFFGLKGGGMVWSMYDRCVYCCILWGV